MNKQSQNSGIKILEVRVRNFRSLQKVDVSLDSLTVLIGENNSGKTSFLEALFAAIGAGKRMITEEDVFLAPNENKPPKDRVITIDLLIRPTDANGGIIDKFPEGSYWLALWGNGVSQDENDNDFVAIRTQMKWNTTRDEYITDRRFLLDWPVDSDNLLQAKINEKRGSVSTANLDPIALDFMDAKRDIQDELHNRSSFWHKLVSDPGLSDKQVEKIEKALNKLNEEIISSSEVLAHVQEHLNDLYQTVAADKGSVSITPLARHLRDLSKGMDINFSTKGAQTFPLVRHGMGTRSLAAVLTFRAYTTWRQKKAKGDAVHPMLALEEPEAHLHPQAQRALFSQIEAIPGQRIISTHSPYIAGQANIAQFRHFRKDGAKTVVTQIDTTGLSDEDIRKIDRMVMNTRGEILYARALVFFEGETEEQALPIFAERYWNQHLNTLGISMVGVGGDKSYTPFIRLANSFGIRWYIFSAGEANAVKAVSDALKRIGKPEKPEDNPNVFIIPDGKNLEQYLCTDEYKDILIEMIISVNSKNDMHQEALKQEWAKEIDPRQKILQELSAEKNKTRYAKPLAEAITGMGQENLRFPALIRSLLEKMSVDLGLPKKEVVAP